MAVLNLIKPTNIIFLPLSTITEVRCFCLVFSGVSLPEGQHWQISHSRTYTSPARIQKVKVTSKNISGPGHMSAASSGERYGAKCTGMAILPLDKATRLLHLHSIMAFLQCTVLNSFSVLHFRQNCIGIGVCVQKRSCFGY